MDYFESKDANDLFNSLKKKYKTFILEYLKDFNGSRAYRKVFNPTDEFANSHASRLLNDPKLKRLLEYYYEQQAVSKTEIVSNLKARINDPTRTGREQLAAIKILCAMHGWLEQKDEQKTPTTINVTLAPQHGHDPINP